jgi:hypothetical protein
VTYPLYNRTGRSDADPKYYYYTKKKLGLMEPLFKAFLS